MILQKLCEYYDRRKDIMPPYGRQLVEMGFIFVIDKNGKFRYIEDHRDENSGADQFMVRRKVKRSSNKLPNYLYDSLEYVLGDLKNNSKENEKNSLFREVIFRLSDIKKDNMEIKAVRSFYENHFNENLIGIQADPLWETVKKELTTKYAVFSFKIDTKDDIIAENEELLSELLDDEHGEKGQCLITGEYGDIVTTTASTMIPGSQATATLVAFQASSGYDSYGRKQCLNAPISKTAEFKYTSALLHLLYRKSKNKFILGSRTFLFWASNTDGVSKQAENALYEFFNPETASDDNPDANVEQVAKTFRSIYSGIKTMNQSDRFHILALAPNSARLAVTYWCDMSLSEFSVNIIRHFDDFEIVDSRDRKDKKPYTGLKSILGSVTLGGKVLECLPSLPESVTQSIIQGTPYPYTLFSACLRRIKADGSISITRAAIIKAFLNRFDKNNKPILTHMDTTNTNPGYLCGRLFAVLEKIQSEAGNPASIRERFLNSASSSPASVFPTILNLSFKHSEKLSDSRRIYFERLKSEIFEGFSSEGFPDHISLPDQGRFFVGYYQQKAEFYKKKNSDTESDNN